MLISLIEMLKTAIEEHYAVGYFEAWDIYSLEAVTEAAEALNAPVVIGFGESMTDASWNEAGGIERLAGLAVAAAESAKAPMALIFNEAASLDHAVKAVQAGFNCVMLDSSDLPYPKHLQETKELTVKAHKLGAAVEAELGELPSASRVGEMRNPDHGALTDPVEAARFVSDTGIDALSVSIGNVHLLLHGTADIDMNRLHAINEAVDVPLVVHGGSGFPDCLIPEAIRNGVAKINVGTILKQRFFEGLVDALQNMPEGINIHELMGSRRSPDLLGIGKACMKEEVLRRIKVYNPQAGR
jgi:fructose-bisphosphate aldolase class II